MNSPLQGAILLINLLKSIQAQVTENQVTTTEGTETETPGGIRDGEGRNDNETTRSTTENDFDDVDDTSFNIAGTHKVQ